jgi:S-adenosylmethionine synthetase
MTTKRQDFVFTSESVAAGHPDKLCDQVSDAILDQIIRVHPQPSRARGAIEVLATTQHLTIAGELNCGSDDLTQFEDTARRVVRDLGYVDPRFDFDAEHCTIVNKLHRQSGEIAEMVEQDGAGDQGLMFGFANRDTDSLLPMPIFAAHTLVARIDELRSSGTLPYLRTDGKCQFSVRYVNDRPVAVERLVIAVPHDEGVAKNTIAGDLLEHAVKPVLSALKLDFTPDPSPAGNYIVNGTGDWHIGGPHSDTGLTGRKIIVDTYGGWGRHGGGCFSGKDPTKVDRSAAYMARYVAKNIVAAGLADSCEIQVAYAIGRRDPLSLTIRTDGSSPLSDAALEQLVRDTCDFAPRRIIEQLDLIRPIYEGTAAYGHFGRELEAFTWERTDLADELRAAARTHHVA